MSNTDLQNRKNRKNDFPVFARHPELAYLDSASTTQTPRAVLEAMNEYYEKYRANTHRGQYTIAIAADERYEGARKKIAAFINADPSEIIFASGATDSLNRLIAMLENSDFFHAGDEIVTTVMEHHSLILPLQQLAKRKGLAVKYVGMDEDFELEYAQAEKLLSEKTKLLAFAGVSNVTGTIHDTQKLCALAKKYGAISAVDAAQMAGHISTDVKKLGCDFLFFSGHKMLGPTGIGVLYGKKEWLEKLEPGYFGGGMVEESGLDASQSRWTPPPGKFEAGTQNIAGAIGLGAACDFLAEIGIENIETPVREITKYALEKLSQISGVKLFCEKNPEKNAGVVSFTLDGAHPHDAAEILSRKNIAVRAGHHCALPLIKTMKVPALTRASFHIYNTKEDIDALAAGVEEVKKLFA